MPEYTEEQQKPFTQYLLNSNCMPVYFSEKDFQEAYVPEILQEGKLTACLGNLHEEK